MVEVTAQRTIEAPAQVVWGHLSSFEEIERFVSMIAHSETSGSGVGAQRVCTTHDGGVLKERLESIDEAGMTLTYSIVSSPMPVTGYVSTMQVRPEGRDRCSVQWACSFEAAPEAADELRGMFHGVYTDGLDGLARLATTPQAH